MTRWQPNARGRLAQAALELYGERGFEQTTAAEIAERAGLTERTFFRHFADKREVLFAGAGSLQDLLVSTLSSTPDSAAPIDAVAAAIRNASAKIQQEAQALSAGFTIMGTDAVNSVTNSFGQTHEIANLYVAGPGIFPTEGAPNPTYTIFALSLRGADHLVAQWGNVAG